MSLLGRLIRRPPLRPLLRRYGAAGRPFSGGGDATTSVWSFGDNSNGAVGLQSPLQDAYEPTRVLSLPGGVAGVAAGNYHSLAISSSGELWSWGRNEEGQLGRLPGAPRDTWSQPYRVVGLDHVRVRATFASGVVSVALADDGSLWVWGRSKRGQLGLGKGVTEATKPTKVEALTGQEIVKVSFGWGHALAQTKDGKLYGWGYAESGRIGQMGQALGTQSIQLRNRDEDLEKSTMLEVAEKLVAERLEKEKNMVIIWEPTIVEELASFKVSDISCGLDHSLILCSDGTLLSCGDNTYGQLGRDTEGSKMLPLPVHPNLKPISLSAGLGHSLVLCQLASKEAKEETTCVLSCGWNRSNQLGRYGPEGIPALVEGLDGKRLVSVCAGRVHSIALSSKGEVWAWGSGRNGRLGLGSSADEKEPAMVESLEGSDVLQAVAGFDHNLLLVAE